MTGQSWPQALRLRLRSLRRRADVERDLDDELGYHVEQATEALIASGLDPIAARAAALRQIGGLEHTKDEVRDTWRVRLWDQCRHDVTMAVRTMRRTPGATAMALLTLAIAIGATTAVFSIVNGVLLRPPYPDADRLFWMQERTPRGDLSAVSASNYLDWQQASQTFDIAAWGFGPPVTLSTGGVLIPLRVTYVAPNYFDVLRVRPLVGRVFVNGEQQPGRDHVAILSHAIWATRFGADPQIVGKTLRLRGDSYEVVGVMPAAASHGEWSYTEIWLPHTVDETSANRAYRAFNTYARLRPGVSEAQGRAEIETIAARLADAYPESNKGWTIALMRYMDVQVNPRLRQSLYLLLAAAGAILLIGCVNLANILLAKSLARERDVAIRAALGGGRRRLLAQFATEGVLLSLVGGALGLLVARFCLSIVRVGLPAFSSANAALPPADAVTIDGRVLAFSFIVSLVTAVAFALVPARAAARVNLAHVMKDRPAAGERARLARRALVVAEVALTFVLMTTAGVVLDTFNRLSQVDAGFDDHNLLTATVPLDLGQVNNTAAERRRYLGQLLDRVRSVPGVQSAALTSILPLQGTGNELPCEADLSRPTDRDHRQNCFFKMVTPRYFTTLGLPVRAGRAIDNSDQQDASHFAVVNETLARQYGGPTQAIGRRITLPELITSGRTRLGADVAWQIVGVVGDEHAGSPADDRPHPGVYVSLDQNPTRRPALVVRTVSDPAALEPALRRAVADVNPDQPLADVRTVAEIKSASLGSERQRSVLLAAFASVSLLLAAIGIYGVVSYSVVQRTGEIGIRAAIGASAAKVMRLVIADGLRLTLFGLMLGVLGAVAASRIATSFLFGAASLDVRIVATATLILIAVSFAACLIPARRASRIDPSIAMRAQ